MTRWYNTPLFGELEMYEGDDINLLYVLRQHGWSEVLLFVGGEVSQFWVTHLFSDPSADLAQLAIALHKRTPSVDLLLCDEPGGCAIHFVQLPDRRHMYAVRVCSFPEGPPAPSSRSETLITEFTVKADHFVKLITSELEKTVRLLEESSFREQREFAYIELNHLRQQLKG